MRSPVVTAANVRVVGMPRACIASLTMNSRSTGPSAARPVAVARERRRTGALELNVVANAVVRAQFAQQDRAAVTQLRHPIAELMTRVGHSERLGALGHAVAGQYLDALRRFEPGRIEAQSLRERPVDPDQARARDRRRRQPGVEAFRQPRISIVEAEQIFLNVRRLNA